MVQAVQRSALVTAVVVVTLAMVINASASPATGGDEQRRTLVEGADAVLAHFLGDERRAQAIRAALADARGVLIIAPDGVESGVHDWRGLLFGHAADGGWTGPAVYTVVSGTFGRSPTEQVDRVLFIVRSDVERLIAERIRFGGSGVSVAELAPGPPPRTDVVAVTDAAAGADPLEAFAGTVISPDQSATNALFGKPITIREAVASRAEIGDDITALRRHLDAATSGP